MRRLQNGDNQLIPSRPLPGSFPHLVSRFFDFVFAKPLTDSEIELLSGWLTQPEAQIFFSQDSRDQAHGFKSASYVARRLPSDLEAIRAAALHDVGKRHAGLGAIGRSIASILIKFHLPLTRRMERYRDHGDLGARDLASVGSSETVVRFARVHHGDRPEDIDLARWTVLHDSDR
jgi:putative nucleotidyltransferase with HDIG domain